MEDYVGNRLNHRIAFKLKVGIKGKNLKEKIYYTTDIAPGGFFVPSEEAPPLSTPVEVKIYLPHSKKSLKIAGKVLRIKWAGNFNKIEGFAIEFKKIDRETEDKFLNFLNKLSKDEI